MLRALATAALLLTGFTAASSTSCTSGGLWGSDCNVSNNGDSITIGATRDGSDGGSERSGTTDGIDEADDSSEGAARSVPNQVCSPRSGCFEVATLPTPTLSDLTTFAPAPPSVSGEPAGVGIVGMPANLVTAAGEHVVTGQLFTRPVTVRFTPVSFTFSYGDGATRTASTGGRTWADLGQAQFTPTDTTHVYTVRGTYTARATVSYAASVDFGGGWIDVPGVLRLTSGGYAIEVFEARTALVARTCQENPGGPGC